MSSFDPSKPAMVHDRLNGRRFRWNPAWAESYRQYGRRLECGAVVWDGLVLDGWLAVGARPAAATAPSVAVAEAG